MKKILFDATTTNIADSTGVGLATLSYLNAIIAVKNQELDVLMGEGDGFSLHERYNVIYVPKRSFGSKIFGLVHGHVHIGADEVIRRVKSGNYSLVCLNSGIASGALVKQIRSYGVETMVLHHNYEPDYSRDSKSIYALWGLSTFFVSLLEGNAYKYSSANLFLTAEDKNCFEVHYGQRRNNFVLGMFEYSHKELPGLETPNPKTIAISCSLDSIQNVLNLRAIHPYFDEIYKSFPDWKILIMGRNPSEEILNLSNLYPNVDVYPNPKDIQALCASCSIYFCPMDRGGGLKLRVMDGLRNGMPVISHFVSARGYSSFVNKPYFVVYNSLEELLNGLMSLVEKLELGIINRESIQHDYYKEFSYNAGIERMYYIFKSLGFTTN